MPRQSWPAILQLSLTSLFVTESVALSAGRASSRWAKKLWYMKFEADLIAGRYDE